MLQSVSTMRLEPGDEHVSLIASPVDGKLRVVVCENDRCWWYDDSYLLWSHFGTTAAATCGIGGR
jgi:hypothetical protein